MDIAQLLPRALTIPAPVHLLEILLLATFAVHILLMNTVLGGAIIALCGELLGRKEADDSARHLVARAIPTNLALTINFGVAPLLFAQVLFGQFLYTSCILSAWYWLAVILLVILAYYGLYIYDLKYSGLSNLRALVLAVCVLLLLDTAFIFVNVMSMAQTPADWPAYFDLPGGRLLHLNDPTLWPRYLHFIMGSITVGGLFTALVALRGQRKYQIDYSDQIAWGMRWFTFGTIIQMAVGVWFFLSLPREIMTMMLGRSGFMTGLLMAGIGMSLVAVFFGFRKDVKSATISMLIIVCIMVLLRHLVRLAYMAPYFSLSYLKTDLQFSPLVLFIVSLVLVAAACIWMIKQAVKASAGPDGHSDHADGKED